MIFIDDFESNGFRYVVERNDSTSRLFMTVTAPNGRMLSKDIRKMKKSETVITEADIKKSEQIAAELSVELGWKPK